jgi:cytochrome b subunit of formate dehydrogenase
MSEQVSEQVSGNGQKYPRFPLWQRIEHLIVLTSFTVLALTGLVQKFGTAEISQTIVAALGGLEVVRIIHRVAAIVLALETVFHIGAAGYQLIVLRKRPDILPSMVDVRNAVQGLLYNLRLAKTRPQQGRFTFEEKFEYWRWFGERL